jgi:hypothetical protein
MAAATKERTDVADIGRPPSASDRLTMTSDYYSRSFAATCLPAGKSWQVNQWIDALVRHQASRLVHI